MGTILKIAGIVLVLIGSLIVYSAGYIVRKLKLYEKVNAEFEPEQDAEQLQGYKIIKATANTKVIGMLIVLPGLILILLKIQ